MNKADSSVLAQVSFIKTTIHTESVNEYLSLGWKLLNIFENTYTVGWCGDGEPPESVYELNFASSVRNFLTEKAVS